MCQMNSNGLLVLKPDNVMINSAECAKAWRSKTEYMHNVLQFDNPYIQIPREKVILCDIKWWDITKPMVC